MKTEPFPEAISFQANVTRLLEHGLPSGSTFVLMTLTPTGAATDATDAAVISNITDYRLVSMLLIKMAAQIGVNGERDGRIFSAENDEQ